MARETEQLVVSLEARIRDFERNFQKAGKVANDNFGRVERRAKQSADRLETTMTAAATRVGGAFKAFAGGLLGGLAIGGLAGAIGQFRQIAAGIASIGDEAKRAGVSVKAFQEWKYVAEQNRIGVDALTDGLKELSLRADEFVMTGKGSAAEAFQRLGYSAADLKVKLQDPSALMLEIIGRLEQLDKAAQIRISPTIREILEPLIGHHSEYVFTYIAKRTVKRMGIVRGQRYPLTYSGIQSLWGRRKKKTLTLSGIRIHDIRHDAASKIVRETGNLKVGKILLNHSSLSVTDRYAHVLDAEIVAGMEAVSKSRKNSRNAKKKAA